MNRHGCLVVDGCREHLALLGRNGGVGINELCHHAAHGLDAKCQRSDIEQDDVARTLLVVEDGTLDGSTHGHYLIGVDAL